MIWHNILYGILIGTGFIIPGVSGGVIATILGIYDKTLSKLIHFKKDVKNNLKFLIPLFGGIIISILLFSKIILFLLEEKLEFISYVFIGLIIGCLPYLFKEIKYKTDKNFSIIIFLISFSLGLALFFIEKETLDYNVSPTPLTMILAGIFYSIGKIVPGISGAALLMLLGVYKYFLNYLANPFSLTWPVFLNFIPFIISFILSAIIIIKIINYLLENHFRSTYSAIIGFVISSILFIYPGVFKISSLLITFLAFLISYNLSK